MSQALSQLSRNDRKVLRTSLNDIESIIQWLSPLAQLAITTNLQLNNVHESALKPVAEALARESCCPICGQEVLQDALQQHGREAHSLHPGVTLNLSRLQKILGGLRGASVKASASMVPRPNNAVKRWKKKLIGKHENGSPKHDKKSSPQTNSTIAGGSGAHKQPVAKCVTGDGEIVRFEQIDTRDQFVLYCDGFKKLIWRGDETRDFRDRIAEVNPDVWNCICGRASGEQFQFKHRGETITYRILKIESVVDPSLVDADVPSLSGTLGTDSEVYAGHGADDGSTVNWLDGTKYLGYLARDNGRWGSCSNHDDYSDESKPEGREQGNWTDEVFGN